MIFVNILLFLVLLPFRIVGTVIGGVLFVLGKFITVTCVGLSFILRILSVLVDFLAFAWLFLGIMKLCGVNEIDNWLVVGITTLIIGAIFSFAAWLGEEAGDLLSEWGGGLCALSWKMITL